MEGPDFKHYYPEVYAAVAGENRMVYAYVSDGDVREIDMKPFIAKGGVFLALQDDDVFFKRITVLNHTVAWDLAGNRDTRKCLDLDPMFVFHCPVVPDFPAHPVRSDTEIQQ